MRAETKENFDNLVDTFSGGDGGVRFMALQWLIEAMDKKAAAGDAAAIQVIARVREMSRLIDIAWKLSKNQP